MFPIRPTFFKRFCYRAVYCSVMASSRIRTDSKDQKRYAVLYRTPDGRQRSRSFGRKTDAQREKRKLERESDLGSPYDPQSAKTTVSEYAHGWLRAKRRTTRETTVTTYERALRSYILPTFGNRALGSLRRDEVRTWLHSLDLSPRTVRLYFGVLRELLAEASRDDVISKNPAEGLRLPRAARTEVAPLSMRQVGSLHAAMPPEFRCLVTLGVGAGLRIGEATALTHGAVGHEHIEVRATLVGTTARWRLDAPKTPAARRTIPVPPAVTKELGHGPDDALVVTDSKARPLVSHTFTRIWAAAVEDSDYAPHGTTFHQLRHTYASLLIEAGENPKVVQQRLGHASISETMDTYGHLWPESEDRTRAAVDTALTTAAIIGDEQG